MKRFVLFFFCLIVTATLSAQQQQKIFYNETWQKCDSSAAMYFRLLTLGEDGRPRGAVKDFYISGELQWEGRFTYMDPYDNSNDLEEGLCTWYYKNGNKSSQAYYTSGKINGPSRAWYENGSRSMDAAYYEGALDGLYLEWYETGLLRTYNIYDKGRSVFDKTMFCDEFGECYATLIQNFVTSVSSRKTNKNTEDADAFSDLNWSTIDWTTGMPLESDVSAWPDRRDRNGESVKRPEGYRVASKNGPVIRTINNQVDYDRNFSVDIYYKRKKGKPETRHGLVWAHRNDSNYHTFTVSETGSYLIGGVADGRPFEISRGNTVMNTEELSGNYLGVIGFEDTVQFFVGYTSVYKLAGAEFSGAGMGVIAGENSEVVFTSLTATSVVDAPFTSPDADTKSSRNKLWKSSGSGFMISTDGYIVTNHHVIDGGKEVVVDLVRDGKIQSYDAEIVITDKLNDLAILKIKDDNFKPYTALPYTLKTQLADVGTQVFALGYPLALTELGTELKFTEGTVNSRTGREGMISAYQVSTPVQPGNSGGPLLDYEGNVIGVINEKLFYADNVAFAIKSNYVINLIELLPGKPDLPAISSVKGLPATEQIRIIREYIPLIKVR